MYEFLWFVSGALIYKFLSIVFGLSKNIKVIKDLQINVLTLLGTTIEDISYIRALKYKKMTKLGVDPNQIKIARMKDEQFFKEWKIACIRNIHNSVPNYIGLSFQSWEEAMAILEEYYRNQIREEKEKQ